MSVNGDILIKLIEEDFGICGRGRWWRSEKHSSLVVDKEKGVFYFNAQDVVGEPLVYLTKIRGLTFREAREYLRQFDGYISTIVYTIKNEPDGDTVVFPDLVQVFYENGMYPERRQYWYDRGINDNTIDRFQLGWYNGYCTIPIFMEGVFRNFQLRRDIPTRSIKGYYKRVGPLLFNSDVLRLTDTVYITEGLTDCLRLSQEGIPAVSHNTGAGGWMDEWFKYFIRQKNIYIIFDNDKAGMDGIKRVSKNLGIFRTHLYTFKGYDEKYDIVDFFRDGGTKDQLLELIGSESKYLFELTK